MLSDKFEFRIGGFEFYPIPDKVIMNCHNCNKKLYNSIEHFNSYKDFDKLLKLKCGCYENYLEQKKFDKQYIENKSLDERIFNIMYSIKNNIRR